MLYGEALLRILLKKLRKEKDGRKGGRKGRRWKVKEGLERI